MDDLLSKLAEQAAVIRAAPYPFILAVVIVAGAIWIAINWAYSSVLSSKNAQLELADRQLGDYRQKLSGATPDEAAQRIAELERKVSALGGPRRLSQEQRQAFSAAATLSAGTNYTLEIRADMLCNDCVGFADQFAALLSSMRGWTVNGGGVGRFAGGAPPSNGMVIAVPNLQSRPPEALLLADALTKARIEFQWTAMPPMPGGSAVALIVRPAG